MGYKRVQKSRGEAKNRAAAEPLNPGVGRLGTVLTPEPGIGSGVLPNSPFPNSPMAHEAVRRAEEAARNPAPAPLPMYGESKDYTPQQSLSRAGPDFSSAGNPFAEIAESWGVQRGPASQGRAAPSILRGPAPNIQRGPASQTRAAPSYGGGKGSAPQAGIQQRGAPYMGAPTGGGNGQE